MVNASHVALQWMLSALGDFARERGRAQIRSLAAVSWTETGQYLARHGAAHRMARKRAAPGLEERGPGSRLCERLAGQWQNLHHGRQEWFRLYPRTRSERRQTRLVRQDRQRRWPRGWLVFHAHG